MPQRDTLLIYGDSFAEPSPHHMPRERIWHDQTTWHRHIIDSGVWRRVVIHAEGGTSLWSQYQRFQRTYIKNADVLWFETDPARIVTPQGHRFTGLYSVERVLADPERHLKNRLQTPDVLDAYRAAFKYYTYLYRPEYTEWIHQRILDSIRRQAHNVRFVPCFPVSLTYNDQNPHVRGQMCAATVREIHVYATHYPQESKTWTDARRNHMTEQNHAILADMIVGHYTRGTVIDCEQFVEPSPSTFSKYFYDPEQEQPLC